MENSWFGISCSASQKFAAFVLLLTTTKKQCGYLGRLDGQVAYTPKMNVRQCLMNAVSLSSQPCHSRSTNLISQQIPPPLVRPFLNFCVLETVGRCFKSAAEIVYQRVECGLRVVGKCLFSGGLHAHGAQSNDIRRSEGSGKHVLFCSGALAIAGTQYQAPLSLFSVHTAPCFGSTAPRQ